MPEYNAPGVYIEEKASGAVPTTGVSTSTGAFVGYAERGPENTPVLVTSFDRYLEKFGSWSPNSHLPTAVAAFFQNGGQSAYIVRVPPGDATLGEAKVLGDHTGDDISVGDGTAAVSETALTTGFAANDGATPIRPSSVKLRWRSAGAPAVNGATTARDGSTVLNALPGLRIYEGRVDPALLPEAHGELLTFDMSAALTLEWTTGAAPASITMPAPGAGQHISTATNGQGSSATLDLKTGIFSLSIDASETPDAAAITFSGTPAVGDPGEAAVASIGSGANGAVSLASATPGTGGNAISVVVVDPTPTASVPLTAVLGGGVLTITLSTTAGNILDTAGNTGTLVAAAIGALPEFTATASGTGADPLTSAEPSKLLAGGREVVAYWQVEDDGLGGLIESISEPLTANGTITYADGAFSLTTVAGAEPWDGGRILGEYTIEAWDLDPVSRGVWSDQMRVVITGNEDSFDAFTASYSKFDVAIQLYNAAILGFDVLQSYVALEFADPTDGKYWVDAINGTSRDIRVNVLGANENPGQLNGVAHSTVIAGGDESVTGKTVTGTLGTVARRSLVITATGISGATLTVTDDGSGNLIGDVDPSGNNVINTKTGAFDVTFSEVLKQGTVATAAHYSPALATSIVEHFGDDAKGYTSGTEGTFDGTNYGQAQITDLSLSLLKRGIYALDLVDELLLCVVPDFVEDATITRQLMDYADSRSTQPNGADRFFIFGSPRGLTAQEQSEWIKYTLARYTKYSAMYSPWLRVSDPLKDGRDTLRPPIGHIAGAYARTDNTRTVSKTPAGTVDGQLRFQNGVEITYTQGDRGVLHTAKIQAIKSDPLVGTAIWGGRTLSQQSEWRNIVAVRLFMYVGRLIHNNTQWTVFENNGNVLRTRVKTQLDGMLGNLFDNGYFKGTTASEAFQVICDETNNTPASEEAGHLIVDVLMAPNRPAEFVRFRLQNLLLE